MKNKPTERKRWTTYYERVNGRSPQKTVLKAIDLFDETPAKFAIDLGCGTGSDTRIIFT